LGLGGFCEILRDYAMEALHPSWLMLKIEIKPAYAQYQGITVSTLFCYKVVWMS